MPQRKAPPLFRAIDGHVDLVYDMMRRHPGKPFTEIAAGAVTRHTLAAGGVRIIVSALYCPDRYNGRASALPHLRGLMAYAREQLRGVVPIHDRAGLDAHFDDDAPPGLLTLLENADALVEMGEDEFASFGPVAVGLTHAGRNRLGDGNDVAAPAGLTAAGRRLVRRLDRQGVALDLAHLSPPCFREALELFRGPVMSSHTGLRAFCDRPRNLTPDQVAAIVNRGGIVGVAAAPEMLTGRQQGSMEDLFRQIDRIVQRHGAEPVAIGSDFGGFDGENHGFGDHGAFPRLAERLLEAGYGEESVGLIMGGNWRRWYGAILGAGQTG
ncbi:MAG TPA: membrane dipeptidase [Desulfuromonadaceae bacterium]